MSEPNTGMRSFSVSRMSRPRSVRAATTTAAATRPTPSSRRAAGCRQGRQRVADVLDDLRESPIGGLPGERGEDPDEVEAGLQHGGELPGEEHQRREADTPRDSPERPLEDLTERRGARSIGGADRDDELPAVPEPLHQLRRVLRLLPAPADGAGAIHDLVLENRHRYS